jgi:hypothetical protein
VCQKVLGDISKNKGEGFCPEGGGREEVAQIMYTHVNKCKNIKL